MFVADFSWVSMPHDDFWAGMYTKPVKADAKGPEPFEAFHFIIDRAPDSPFEIFHIPMHLMFKAGYEAGFSHIETKAQYPDPEVKDDPVVRRYLDTCNPNDYLMKFKF